MGRIHALLIRLWRWLAFLITGRVPRRPLPLPPPPEDRDERPRRTRVASRPAEEPAVIRWQDTVAKAPNWPPVSSSTHTAVVPEDPMALLAQARAKVGEGLTLEAYAAARLAASEHFKGSPEELGAIIDAELNRAQRDGLPLWRHLTGGTGRFGKQGGVRRASTKLDPSPRHVAAARAVLEGRARGISRGAVRFFDPKVQKAMSGPGGDGRHCPPLVILETWSYDRRRRGCQFVSGPGDDKQAWVGPIPGIDAYRLMLFKPAKGMNELAHRAAYRAAKRVIETGEGRPGVFDSDLVGLALALAVGLARAKGVV